MSSSHEVGRQEVGRHEAEGRRSFWRSDLPVREYILLFGLAAGLCAAAIRWIVHTPLLGAHLPTAVHVTFVVAFLALALLSLIAATLRLYRRLARWSQDRRSRERTTRR